MAPPDRYRATPMHNTPNADEQNPIVNPDTSDGGTHVRVNVTVDDVSTGTDDLFSTFLHHRLERDGYTVPQNLRTNHRLESAAAREIIRIADQVNDNQILNNCISQLHVTTETAYETFACVAMQLFQDGVINWGRIVMLFVFGYKLALRVIECKSTLLYVIMKWITKFVVDKLAHWIISQGGWGYVSQNEQHQQQANYPTPSNKQALAVVVLAGLVLSFFYWKRSR